MTHSERSIAVMRYDHALWDGREPERLDGMSYEDVARRALGPGLTLVDSGRIISLHHLVGKVWDGSGFRYAYRF